MKLQYPAYVLLGMLFFSILVFFCYTSIDANYQLEQKKEQKIEQLEKENKRLKESNEQLQRRNDTQAVVAREEKYTKGGITMIRRRFLRGTGKKLNGEQYTAILNKIYPYQIKEEISPDELISAINEILYMFKENGAILDRLELEESQ